MSLAEGVDKLKKGSLFAIAADLLTIASIGFAFLSVGIGMSLQDIQKMFLVLGAVLIPFLVALILGIVGFIFWFQATGKLKNADDNLGIGRTGMILQIAGISLMILSMIVAILLFSASHVTRHSFEPQTITPAIGGAFIGMMVFMALGGLLIIVGAILFGIMLLRLSKVEGVDQGFNTAGILYLISIVASVVLAAIGGILMFVSLILIYMAADKSLKNLQSMQTFS